MLEPFIPTLTYADNELQRSHSNVLEFPMTGKARFLDFVRFLKMSS